MRIEGRRECRICHCHERDRCWERRDVKHPLILGATIPRITYCSWVAPDLCSFCAADGGPDAIVKKPQGAEHFSGLLGPDGEPLRWSKDLPR